MIFSICSILLPQVDKVIFESKDELTERNFNSTCKNNQSVEWHILDFTLAVLQFNTVIKYHLLILCVM